MWPDCGFNLQHSVAVHRPSQYTIMATISPPTKHHLIGVSLVGFYRLSLPTGIGRLATTQYRRVTQEPD